MNDFLLGGPFNNILNSLGWTEVNTWNVLYQNIKKQYVVVLHDRIKPQSNFSEVCETEKQIYSEIIKEQMVTAYVSACDPREWEICRFLLSVDVEQIKQRANRSLIYQLNHLS
jgi:hypothetical protein